jgi:hypothetical protein
MKEIILELKQGNKFVRSKITEEKVLNDDKELLNIIQCTLYMLSGKRKEILKSIKDENKFNHS